MNPNHVFLYEYVPQGSRVLMYGWGAVGRSYAAQVAASGWCKIVGVIDRSRKSGQFPAIRLDAIGALPYDVLLLAIEKPEIVREVYPALLVAGVPQEKIVNLHMRTGDFPPRPPRENHDSVLQILIVEGGGLGDTLLDVHLAAAMARVAGRQADIHLACPLPAFFAQFPYFRKVFAYEKGKPWSTYPSAEATWDLVLGMYNFPLVRYADHERIERLVPELAAYVRQYEELYQHDLGRNAQHYRFTHFALLYGKNRLEQLDLYGQLGLTRRSRIPVPLSLRPEEVLERFRLQPHRYIVVARDAGGSDAHHPKLWPAAYYKRLLQSLKAEFPALILVSVGVRGGEGWEEACDVRLIGRTSLEELKVLLKYACLHIGSEGGLVHLCHELGGVSAVFFGPTSPAVFCYDENLNFAALQACPVHCEWLSDRWTEGCMRGFDVPPCMEENRPEDALPRICAYLRKTVTGR